MTPNLSLILAKHPSGIPIPGEDLVIKTEEIDLNASIPEGSVLLKTLYLSFDPYQRGRMRPQDYRAYAQGYKLGSPMHNAAILSVVKSSSPSFVPGELLLGMAAYSNYQIIGAESLNVDPYKGGFIKLDNPFELDVKVFLGALGMSGLTAYSSFYEIGQPKKGDVIFISAASGAVGQIVGQLAKREGLKVIGSVGSQEKLDFITKELGFDGGLNYKAEGLREGLERALKEVGGEGAKINIYYDNVGGEQLDLAIFNMADFGRIILCGSISQSSVSPEKQYGLKNMALAVGRRLTLRGFIVADADMGPKYTKEHQANLGKWIKDGEIKVLMDVTEGMENAAEGLVGMLQGKNLGKAVLMLADA